ncbi:MAG: hypothetical protein CFE34_13930 [Rhodobacteraceae bacterium PARR1]|nr:MAG: hypothetical protein CFE34_13930 [Rhodobacteraceae bacterium PARR1]
MGLAKASRLGNHCAALFIAWGGGRVLFSVVFMMLKEVSVPEDDAVGLAEATLRTDLWQLKQLYEKYIWAPAPVRAEMEAAGINLSRPDFYSESPTLADIETSYEYPAAGGDNGFPAYEDPQVFDDATITATVRQVIDHSRTFRAETTAETGFYWTNSQFTSIDALGYYGLIASHRPRRIVEIGSGFSTHVASAAIRDNEIACSLTCIDPEPRTDIEVLPNVNFLRQYIQNVPPSSVFADLEPGDIVFYDGSHTVKTGSDTVYFYLKLLPYLPRGVIVHAHDVFLPYPRPRSTIAAARISWSEQYLLMAHLHNTARYKVLYPSNYIAQRHPDLTAELLDGRVGPNGGSLWFRINES